VRTASEVTINAEGVQLEGELVLPERTVGVVAFAHGSGSSRHSPRNQFVASSLQEAGLGTLLFDLLQPGEEQQDAPAGRLRFDIPLLSARLVAVVDWLANSMYAAELPIGCFGASTGAAAALVAAAARPARVGAVVSRGGRPDLAGDALAQGAAPTLLIVGGEDQTVLEFNQDAAGRMTATAQLEVIPGATHLFEEPGALELVAALARDWFLRWLPPR
jgi:putative phosphoribosyl transferase